MSGSGTHQQCQPCHHPRWNQGHSAARAAKDSTPACGRPADNVPHTSMTFRSSFKAGPGHICKNVGLCWSPQAWKNTFQISGFILICGWSQPSARLLIYYQGYASISTKLFINLHISEQPDVLKTIQKWYKGAVLTVQCSIRSKARPFPQKRRWRIAYTWLK